ncbi:PepSY domain-containing protein [Maribacter sp. 2307UL18-2]|uniref:PepSY domain-containing protein n=1 Tax=Maribacter sp. 2307UL18-2 TaxID=3386274 RepID=UPI0039BD4824
MTVSIWRYSHLVLALTSALFLVLASVTGAILAFEPIISASKPYKPIAISGITLSETIEALENHYDEVLSLEVDHNDFLIASVVTSNGDSETIFVHPKTGEKLGEPTPQSSLFQFTTNLHRSLFLKSIGRFFVGVVSFLLCLIAVTGLVLIIKRQGGVQKLFSRVQKDYFELRYHVILGRLFLAPIILVAATGVYLSAEKFSHIPNTERTHQMLEPNSAINPDVMPNELQIFTELKLSEVRSVNFPFSEMPEDYFEVTLKDKEVYVDQYTGQILSEVNYPFTALASRWSLFLHTGQGSALWALVLLSASISILFFVYSGLVMWIKRRRSVKSNFVMADKDEASHIVLVGSETGNTFRYAKQLSSVLTHAGKSVFMTELNRFSTYEKAEHFIILTSTYGEGDAPTNARNFATLLTQLKTRHTIKFAVVGFGSLLYPDYCAFALAVDGLLEKTDGFERVLPIHKINNQNDRVFQDWVHQWTAETKTPIAIQISRKRQKVPVAKPFTVVERTALNDDSTFLIRLRPHRKASFQSGDLAGIVPDDGIKRQYSIAKMENDILLSVKKHAHGVCSPLLSELELGETMKVLIEENIGFHFPKNNQPVLLIANGTGIAPFLGMLHENRRKVETYLFLGLQKRKSLALYEGILSRVTKRKKLTDIQIAYSREDKCNYVQDLVKRNPELISNLLRDGGSIYICGSLNMQKAVLRELESITAEKLNTPLSIYEHREQLKMDCY